jgi:hypothetical protein
MEFPLRHNFTFPRNDNSALMTGIDFCTEFPVRYEPTWYKACVIWLYVPGVGESYSEGSQSRQTIKYGSESRRTRNCAGEDKQQFTSQPVCFLRMTEWASDSQLSHCPVEGERPAAVRPLLSSKRRPHFKTSKNVERRQIWSWVPTGSKTKNNCASDGQQQFTRLDWT